MFQLHCTKKLLDRIKPAAIAPDSASGTLLGNWYATALLWKPQVALLVNEKTLLPVLMPLAPAANLAVRFPEHLAGLLMAHGMPQQFIDRELTQMHEVQYAKTANRSVVGIMNQFTYLAEGYREYLETKDLLSPQSVALVVKASVARVGGDSKKVSGHSLRAGYCTSAAEKGLQPWQIREQTGHKSDVTLAKYIRPVARRNIPSLL